MFEYFQKENKQITKKYVSGVRGKAKAALDKLRAKGMSGEGDCVHELLFLCEFFEKTAERLTNIEKDKNTEITKLVSKHDSTEKNLNALQNKVLVIESSRSEFLAKLQDVQNSMGVLEKERNELLKAIENMKNQMRMISRDRVKVQKSAKKLETQLTDKDGNLKKSVQSLEANKNEIQNLKNSVQQQSRELSEMQKMRDRCTHELEINAKIIKKKDVQLMELNETLAKSKASQEVFRLQSIDFSRKLDVSVSDGIMLRREIKILTKNRDEIEEVRQKINVEREALKENVARLETSVKEAQKEIEQLHRANDIQKAHLKRSCAKSEELNASLQQKTQEIVILNKAIASCGDSITKLHNQVDDRQNEKDFIGTQIVRRNDEIALLTEKLEVTQLALNRSESQCKERLEDIRLLKIESTNLKTTIDVLKANAEKMKNWKDQIAYLSRELEDKSIENARLSNALQNPVNVHRWRILSGQDPNRMELIRKLRIMQTRILNQMAVIANKEKQLINANSLKTTQSDTRLAQMKNKLMKMRRTLNKKTKRIKSLEAEIKARKVDSAEEIMLRA